MGQEAVEDVEKVENQVLITNIQALMIYFGINQEGEPRLAMVPR